MTGKKLDFWILLARDLNGPKVLPSNERTFAKCTAAVSSSRWRRMSLSATTSFDA